MTAEIGHFALIVAAVLSLGQSVLPLIGASRRHGGLMALGGTLATGQFVFVLIAFGALTWAYLVSDFSVANVAQNSHSKKPFLYKITGVWGNHEGSMVLWCLILALFGASVAWFGSNVAPSLRARVIGIQGMIGVGFLAFVLLTSNPFDRV
ncbi:MAG: heme lyase NrfEFG subunit NrfE, partial [Rhodospirillaceae bacterium]|nr:heme lyase NrfEFG subunit NrfE [Rhodospirillaceae bacterium]